MTATQVTTATNIATVLQAMMAQQQRSDERFERIQKQSDKRFERLQLETRQQSTQILEMVHTLAAELRTDTSRQIASLR